MGHGKFTNSGGGNPLKRVSDGMIESASTDIKNEPKRGKICRKRLDTSFIYLGFLNAAFDQFEAFKCVLQDHMYILRPDKRRWAVLS